jgi:crotonobetainyl-CoA:carnitine CoA-transferase CaiB-like acyl-CoA transferase
VFLKYFLGVIEMSIVLKGADRKGPLAGYRIIEFGAYFTLPLAAMWLADQGADVIKVESPEGDLVRYAYATRKGLDSLSAAFMNLNRNKRSIVLDIKRPGAVEVFRKLAEGSDVIMQNFRPGVMERFGLGYDDIKKIKPDVIFVSVSGFGTTGPYSKQRAFDHVVQAVSGMTVAQRDPETDVPDLVKTAVVDKVTALIVSQAITAALVNRANTGEGQHIEINMLNSMISFMWPDTMANQSFLGEDVNIGMSTSQFRCIYETSDGYLLTSGVKNADWASLCTIIDKKHLIDDPRFANILARKKHLKEGYEELKDCFKGKATAEWLAILWQHDVVCAPVNSPDDVHLDPQVKALGVFVESEHPHAGSYRQPLHPVQFEKSPTGIRRHAPLLGQHTEEILREVGLDESEITKLQSDGAIRSANVTS